MTPYIVVVVDRRLTCSVESYVARADAIICSRGGSSSYLHIMSPICEPNITIRRLAIIPQMKANRRYILLSGSYITGNACSNITYPVLTVPCSAYGGERRALSVLACSDPVNSHWHRIMHLHKWHSGYGSSFTRVIRTSECHFAVYTISPKLLQS